MDENLAVNPKKSLSQKIKDFFQNLGPNIKKFFQLLPVMGKNIDPDKPLSEQLNVTFIEYIAILITRFGVVLFTTISANNFLYECYYGAVGITDGNKIAAITAGLTTATTICGYVIGAAAAAVTYKWKSKIGRYRQWYLIPLIPMLFFYIFSFYVPKGWTENGMIVFRYILGIGTTIFNGFSGVGDNITQVISPNPKEKNVVVIVQQVGYYLGYGAVFLYNLIFGILLPDNKKGMYLSLAIIAALFVTVGKFLMAWKCKERIELPKKEKEPLTVSVLKLFKDKNYVAYWVFNWVNILAMVGVMTSYLAAITVGTDKGAIFSIPSAVGTVVGVVICVFLQKKYNCTSILKFVGFYSVVSSLLAFFMAFFFGYGIAFYICYFLFGVSLGLQELSTSQFNIQFNDYLEWKTGKRMEAVQGVIPGWINSGINYLKDLAVPFLLAAIGYQASQNDNLLQTAKLWPNYKNVCDWLLAFALFGFAIANLLKSFILMFFYDVDTKKKDQIYKDLEVMHRKRHEELLAEENAVAEQSTEENTDELVLNE